MRQALREVFFLWWGSAVVAAAQQLQQQLQLLLTRPQEVHFAYCCRLPAS